MAKQTYTIQGTIKDSEGKSRKDFLVHAWDKDLFFDDFLGHATSKQNGNFAISFKASDFQEFWGLFEGKFPEVYLRVHGRNHSLTLTITAKWNEDTMELDCGTIEIPALSLPYVETRTRQKALNLEGLIVAPIEFKHGQNVQVTAYADSTFRHELGKGTPDFSGNFTIPLKGDQLDLFNLTKRAWFLVTHENKQLYHSPKLNPVTGERRVRILLGGNLPDYQSQKRKRHQNGRLSFDSGHPAASYTVQLIEQTSRNSQLLAETVSQADGSFRFNFPVDVLMNDLHPTFRYIVLDENGTGLFDSGKSSIELPDEYRIKTSNFTELVEGFSDLNYPIADINDLTLTDVDFMLCEEGYPSDITTTLGRVINMSVNTGLSLEESFALVNAPRGMRPGAAVQFAVDHGFVDGSLNDKLEDIEGAVRKASHSLILQTDSGFGSLNKALASLKLPYEQLLQAGTLWRESQNREEFITRMNGENVNEPTKKHADDLAFVFQVIGTTGNHAELTGALLEQRLSNANLEIETLTEWGVGQWQALLEDNQIEIPPIFLGRDEARANKRFARSLRRSFQNRYPSHALIAELRQKGDDYGSWGPALLEHIEKHVIDVSEPVIRLERGNPDLFNGKYQEVRDGLAAIQRLNRITNNLDATRVLLESGLNSATEIAVQYSKSAFLEAFRGLFPGGDLESEFIINRAKTRASESKGLLNLTSDKQNQTYIAALKDDRKSSQNSETIKGWNALFGADDTAFCECRYCQSIFGPAAYLFDLLLFLRRYTTSALNYLIWLAPVSIAGLTGRQHIVALTYIGNDRKVIATNDGKIWLLPQNTANSQGTLNNSTRNRTLPDDVGYVSAMASSDEVIVIATDTGVYRITIVDLFKKNKAFTLINARQDVTILTLAQGQLYANGGLNGRFSRLTVLNAVQLHDIDNENNFVSLTSNDSHLVAVNTKQKIMMRRIGESPKNKWTYVGDAPTSQGKNEITMIAHSAANELFVATAYGQFYKLDNLNTNSRPLLDWLKERRPDVAHLPLSCDNTNIEVPQIDLINEQLVALIDYNPQDLNSREKIAERSSHGTNAERLAAPEYEPTDAALTKLREAHRPWNLPYDYHWDRAFAASTQLRLGDDEQEITALGLYISRVNIESDDSHNDAEATDKLEKLWFDIAFFELKLIDAELAIINDWADYLGAPDTLPDSKSESIWGEAATAAMNNKSPSMAILMEASGLNYWELESVLETGYLRHIEGDPVSFMEVKITPEIECNLDNLFVEAKPEQTAHHFIKILIRIYLFERLRRQCGWSIQILDEALGLLSYRIDKTSLQAIGLYLHIQRRTGLKGRQLLALFGDPSDIAPNTIRDKTVKSPFAELFVDTVYPDIDPNNNDLDAKNGIHLASLSQATAISSTEILYLLSHSIVQVDNSTTVTQLSDITNEHQWKAVAAFIFRSNTLANALELALPDFLAFTKLAGGLSSQANNRASRYNPKRLVTFIQIVKEAEDWPLKPSELLYIFTDDSNARTDWGPSREQSEALIEQLEQSIQSEASRLSAADSSNTIHILLSSLSALLPKSEQIAEIDLGQIQQTMEWSFAISPTVHLREQIELLLGASSNLNTDLSVEGKQEFDQFMVDMSGVIALSLLDNPAWGNLSGDEKNESVVSFLSTFKSVLSPAAQQLNLASSFIDHLTSGYLEEGRSQTDAERAAIDVRDGLMASILEKINKELRKRTDERIKKWALELNSTLKKKSFNAAMIDVFASASSIATEDATVLLLEVLNNPADSNKQLLHAFIDTNADNPPALRGYGEIEAALLLFDRAARIVRAMELPILSGIDPLSNQNIWTILTTAQNINLNTSGQAIENITSFPQMWRTLSAVHGIWQNMGSDEFAQTFSLFLQHGFEPDPQTGLMTNSSEDEQKLASAFQLSDVEFEEFRNDQKFSPLSNLSILGSYLRLNDIGRSVALTPTELLRWSLLDDAKWRYDTSVAALRAGYPEREWLDVLQQLHDPVRERLRDSLLAWIIEHPIDSLPHFTTPEEISRYLFTDMQMYRTPENSDQKAHHIITTRIRYAFEAVQSYTRRIRSGELPGPNAKARKEFEREWVWRKDYRLWEGNRRLFVTPELWLEPDLRLGKSEIFSQFEDQLMQGLLTGEAAEGAIESMLHNLEEIARPEIIGVVEGPAADTYTPQGFRQVDLAGTHVFARTRSQPHKLYYRRRLPDKRWTTWEHIEVDMPGTHYVPVIAYGRLYLFNAEFGIGRLQPDPCLNEETQLKAGDRSNIVLSWIERTNNGWAAVQRSKPLEIDTNSVLKNQLSEEVEKLADNFHGFPEDRFQDFLSKPDSPGNVRVIMRVHPDDTNGMNHDDAVLKVYRKANQIELNLSDEGNIYSRYGDGTGGQLISREYYLGNVNPANPNDNNLRNMNASNEWIDQESRLDLGDIEDWDDERLDYIKFVYHTPKNHYDADAFDDPNLHHEWDHLTIEKIELQFLDIKGDLFKLISGSDTKAPFEFIESDDELHTWRMVDAIGASDFGRILDIPVKDILAEEYNNQTETIGWNNHKDAFKHSIEEFPEALPGNAFVIHASQNKTDDNLPLLLHLYVAEDAKICSKYSHQWELNLEDIDKEKKSAIEGSNWSREPVLGDTQYINWSTKGEWLSAIRFFPDGTVDINSDVTPIERGSYPGTNAEQQAFRTTQTIYKLRQSVLAADFGVGYDNIQGFDLADAKLRVGHFFYCDSNPVLTLSPKSARIVVTNSGAPISGSSSPKILDEAVLNDTKSRTFFVEHNSDPRTRDREIANQSDWEMAYELSKLLEDCYRLDKGAGTGLGDPVDPPFKSDEMCGTELINIYKEDIENLIQFGAQNSAGALSAKEVFFTGAVGTDGINNTYKISDLGNNVGAGFTGDITITRPDVTLDDIRDGNWEGLSDLCLERIEEGGLEFVNDTVTEHQWLFTAFWHPFTKNLKSRLKQKDLTGLMALKTQRFEDLTFFDQEYINHEDFLNVVSLPHPIEEIDFSSKGTYADYNWELFFHAPLLVAMKLSETGRFEEAENWFHLLFDPSQGGIKANPVECFRIKPLREAEQWRLADILKVLGKQESSEFDEEQLANFAAQIERLNRYAFQPHLIARERPLAYKKALVMKYIDHLMAWGDELFRRAYAADRPSNLAAAGDKYDEVQELLGDRPTVIPNRVNESAQSFAELSEGKGDLSLWDPLIRLEDWQFESPGINALTNGGEGIPDLLYFCVPQEEKFFEYWDELAKRQMKLRAGLTIEGVQQALSLYGRRIDPELLMRATALGFDIDSLLGQLSSPLTRLRFQAIWQRAREACSQAEAFGQNLLSSIEKREGEELARMRSENEITLLKANKDIRDEQVRDAEESIETLWRSRENAEVRFRYYNSRTRISGLEQTEGKTIQNAAKRDRLAADSSATAADLAFIPNIPISLEGFFIKSSQTTDGGARGSAGLSYDFGGRFLSQLEQQKAQGHRATAEALRSNASRLARQGQFDRRWDDWQLQKELAEKDLAQIDRQITSAQIRLQITELERENNLTQIEQSQKVDRYLRDKFTNAKLYRWMESRLRSLYYKQYEMAYELALKAQRSLRFELGLDEGVPILDAWDASQRGALAATKLQGELFKLKAEYDEHMDSQLKALEHPKIKTFSLAERRPLDFLELLQNGSCVIEMYEHEFDEDEPGDYLRRFRQITVSIPCVRGPNMSINCRLTLLRSQVRTKVHSGGGSYNREFANDGNGDARFRDDLGTLEHMVTSTAVNDDGQAGGSPSGEHRFKFEGRGAISTWQIELPLETNLFDRSTITDLKLEINYTAQSGDPVSRSAATSARLSRMQNQGRWIMLSLQDLYSKTWHRFIQADVASRTLTLEFDTERLPGRLAKSSLSVTAAELFIDFGDDDDEDEGESEGGPPLVDAFTNEGAETEEHWLKRAVLFGGTINSQSSSKGPWSISLTDTSPKPKRGWLLLHVKA